MSAAYIGQGAVWVASPTSGEVLRVLRGGEVTQRITTREQPLAVVLAGADRRTLYIASSHRLGPRCEPRSASTSKLVQPEVPMDASIVSRDPEIMSGALCFTGTRVPVKNLFDYLEGSSSLEDFLEDFPSVSRERAVAVLEAARERLAADAPAP